MRSKQKTVLFKIILISLLTTWTCVSAQTTPASPFGVIDYPVTKADPKIIDTYNGTFKVPDPWRALEDPDAQQTKDWMKDLNGVSMKLLCDNPKWPKINQSLGKMYMYKRYGAVQIVGQNPVTYYTFISEGLQNQKILYRHEAADKDPTEVFFDLNAVDPTGKTSLKTYSFSPDGKWFAYFISANGSDWMTGEVIETATKKKGPDCLKEARNSPITWLRDNSGFFYSRYEGANMTSTQTIGNHSIWFHKVGTTQDKDIKVLACPDHPDWLLMPEVSYDGKYLFVTLIDGAGGFNGNALGYIVLDGKAPTGPLNLTMFTSDFTYDMLYINNKETTVYLRTNKNAPNNRVIMADLTKPEESNWQHFIQEDPNGVLKQVHFVNNGQYVCHYIRAVKSALEVHGADGAKTCDVQLGIGQIIDSDGDYRCDKFYYKFQSFVVVGSFWELDLKNACTTKKIREVQVNLPGFDPTKYTTEQKEYPSKDNTLVPIFITKNASLTGPMPCVLYAEGGDKTAVLPFFHIPMTFYMSQFGGAFAVAGIRGGSEKGAAWWQGGYLENKQNAFNDLQWGAKFLVEVLKLTVYTMLTIFGNLAALVLINQAPSLCGAAVSLSPLTDMHRYDNFTIAKAWVAQFGSSTDPKFFKCHQGYSPLHNCFTPNATCQYPNLLICQGKASNRVLAFHALKFMAELYNRTRNNPNQKNGCLCRLYDTGFSGASVTDEIMQYTDILLFIHLSTVPNAVIV